MIVVQLLLGKEMREKSSAVCDDRLCSLLRFETQSPSSRLIVLLLYFSFSTLKSYFLYLEIQNVSY